MNERTLTVKMGQGKFTVKSDDRYHTVHATVSLDGYVGTLAIQFATGLTRDLVEAVAQDFNKRIRTRRKR